MSEPELLDAIAKAGGSNEPFLVYADWLSQNNDPRGELIAVQVALTDRPEDRELLAAEHRLIVEHATSWLGPAALLLGDVLTIEWNRGFIRKVRFGGAYDPEHHEAKYGRLRRDEFLASLLALPAARFIEAIEIGDWWTGRDRMFDVDLAVLDGAPKTLTRLVVAPKGEGQVGGRLFDLDLLLRKHPQLVELELAGEVVDLAERVQLPKLERLSLVEHRPTRRTIHHFGQSGLESLRELSIESVTEPYGSLLLAMLGTLQRTKLEALSLVGAIDLSAGPFAGNFASALAPSLRRLTLAGCGLNSDSIRAIAEAVDGFAQLELLNIDGNELGEGAIELVRNLPCRVVIGTQRGIRYD